MAVSVVSLTEFDTALPCGSQITQPNPAKQNDAFALRTALYELKHGAELFEKLDCEEIGSWL